MSQQKVDRYKYEKANRKQLMRKRRIKVMIEKAAISVVALALVGWLGFSVYNTYTENQERETVAVNYDAVTNYMNGLAE